MSAHVVAGYTGWPSLNIDIGRWDVSAGTNFNAIFYGCAAFNRRLEGWDVSAGIDFGMMHASVCCAALSCTPDAASGLDCVCSSGIVVSGDGTSCNAPVTCSAGMSWSSGNLACTKCPPGTHDHDSDPMSACVGCPNMYWALLDG